MKVLFVNKQPRLLGLCTGHLLKPGKNEVEMTEDEARLVGENKTFCQWQKLGWVHASPVEEKAAPVRDIKEEVDAADLNHLYAWYQYEKDPAVLKLLDARILLLTGTPKEVDVAVPPMVSSPEAVPFLADKTAEEAKVLIEAASVGDLYEWYGAEKRKGVKKMIEARLSVLTVPTEPDIEPGTV